MLSRSQTLLTLILTIVAAFPLHAGAAAAAGQSLQDDRGSCTFSLALQEPGQRNRFVSLLAQTVEADAHTPQKTYADDIAAGNDPESMYNSIVKVSYPEPTSRIDSFSRKCLVCHDGVSAPIAEGSYRNSPGEEHSRGQVNGSSHPIGMDYAAYSIGNRSFKNVEMLDRQMVLVDGKVGCLSCHNPLNPRRNHLAVSDARSELCLACHNK